MWYFLNMPLKQILQTATKFNKWFVKTVVQFVKRHTMSKEAKTGNVVAESLSFQHRQYLNYYCQ